MDRQAKEAKEMTKNLPFAERLVNFWYYRKWVVVGVVAAVLVILLTIYEITNTPQYDLLAGMYLENAVADETVDTVTQELVQYSNDVNEDGDITVSVTPMTASRQYDNEDAVAVQTRIMGELNSGDTMLYIADQAYYDFLMESEYYECFSHVYDLSGNADFTEKVGYNGNLYLLVKDLYPSEEGDANKRAAHNNAVAIYMGIAGIQG